jgi:hypothetical protein
LNAARRLKLAARRVDEPAVCLEGRRMRGGDETEAGLPISDVPALLADVAVISTAGILRAIHEAQRSGLLVYRHRKLDKRIYFDAGEVVFASSNQAVDRLGECLLRSGAIGLSELREAEAAFKPGDRFGRALVERGILTPRELWNGVRSQVEEIVRSLFAVPAGRIWFWQGEIHPDNVVRLSLDTSRLIAEGDQRCAELRQFLAVLDDPRVQLAQTATGVRGSLAGSERELFEAVGAGRAFPELCTTLDLDRESAARSIQLLRLVGAVKLMRLPEGALPPASADSSLLRQAEAFVKLIHELTRAIAEAEGDRAIDARVARELRDVAARFPALLAGTELGPGLSATQLVERAELLPDGGADTLAAALGELVAYLEFEVKNHAKLADPSGLLAALEPLRRAAAG